MRRLAILVLAGCLSTPDPPEIQPNIDGCMARAQSICDLRDRCSAGFQVTSVYGDMETCLARNAVECIDASQIRNTGQTVDRTAQCALEYESMTCATYFDNDIAGACANPAGPGEIGSPCAVASECQTAFCKAAPTSACGTCQPLPKIGDPCEGDVECGRAMSCASASNTCQLNVAAGSPCLTGYVPCGAGLTCMHEDVPTMTMGTCMPAVQIAGQPCDPQHMTAPGCDPNWGLTCVVSSPTATRICAVDPLVGPGEACGPDGPPTTTNPRCAGGGLCKKLPTDRRGICVAAAADGEPCDSDPAIGPRCLEPARCVPTGDGTAGICTVPDARLCY